MPSLVTLALIPVAFLLPIYILFISSPYFGIVDVVPHYPLPKPALDGALTPNERLKSCQKIAIGKIEQPESIALDAHGNMYTGCADGNIYRIFADNHTVELWAYIGGRPLGLDFDKQGNLIVCDVVKGLLSVNPVTRQPTILASHVNGSRMWFVDAVKVAKSGKIYFTDALAVGPVRAGDRWDPLLPSSVGVLAGDPTGRLVEYDPETRQTRILFTGLVMGNGVALSKNEDYVLVAETGGPSIHKYHISGPKAGQREYFIENLPGMPDGISTAPDGRFYVTFVSLRTPIDAILPYPFLKRILIALLPYFPNLTEKVGFIAVADENGQWADSFYDTNGEVTPFITDVQEFDGKLYIGSLVSNFIAVYNLRTY